MADLNEHKLQRTRTRSDVVYRYSVDLHGQHLGTVFPIFQRTADGVSKLVGTGFFIAPHGVFLSAAHVFELEVSPEDSFWIVYLDGDNQPLKLDVGEVRVRPEGRDIAMGEVNVEGLKHPFATVMESLPMEKEVVASLVYSHTLVHEPVQEPNGSEEIQHIQRRWHWEMGVVEQVSHEGYPFTPGPSFISNIFVEGRVSGGPVLNSSGFVVGVNSRGSHPPGELPYSIASGLKGLGKIEWDGISIQDRTANTRLLPIARFRPKAG